LIFNGVHSALRLCAMSDGPRVAGDKIATELTHTSDPDHVPRICTDGSLAGVAKPTALCIRSRASWHRRKSERRLRRAHSDSYGTPVSGLVHSLPSRNDIWIYSVGGHSLSSAALTLIACSARWHVPLQVCHYRPKWQIYLILFIGHRLPFDYQRIFYGPYAWRSHLPALVAWRIGLHNHSPNMPATSNWDIPQIAC
jgi:hypothetical protein